MTPALLQNLEEGLGQRYNARVDALDREISALKASHAAKGLLKSGATLKKVRDLCIATLDDLSSSLVPSKP